MTLRDLDGPTITMTVQRLHPYLHFLGEAQAAIHLYEHALGARVAHLTRYGDAPMPVPDDHKDRIMHAELHIDGHALMLSDGPPGYTAPLGSAFQVVLEFSDDAAMARAFDALLAGGDVVMPLQDMFWGGRIGMLVDRFRVRWMLLRNQPCA